MHKQRSDENKAKSSADASKEMALMQQQARDELEKSRENSSKESEDIHEQIRMKERAKMQIEVKKVQEELDKVSK